MDEGAHAHLRLLERALKEEDPLERLARVVGEQGRVVRLLPLPDRIELIFDMSTLGIEVVALIVAAHADAPGVAAREELAERFRAFLRHRLVERLRAERDLAVLIVLGAPLRLAIGFEPTALIEVEQRAADLVRLQPLVERPRA